MSGVCKVADELSDRQVELYDMLQEDIANAVDEADLNYAYISGVEALLACAKSKPQRVELVQQAVQLAVDFGHEQPAQALTEMFAQ